MFPLLQIISDNLTDAAEGQIGGKPLGYYLAVGDNTADWPAWLFVSGLRYWNHKLYCCPKCSVTLANMTCIDKLSSREHDCSTFEVEEYEALVTAFEKVDHFADEIRRQLLERAQNTKRK